MKYYAAYGSNTELRAMKERCSGAEFVGKATLLDHSLRFNYYLDVDEEKGSKIQVAIFKISEEDEERLDHYEGYPSLYKKKTVNVMLLDTGGTVEALIYFMPKKDYSLPEESYLFTCILGYVKCGLDTKQLYLAYTQVLRCYENVARRCMSEESI